MPKNMWTYYGMAVAHGNTAYFSNGSNVYSYKVQGNKWTKLEPCIYMAFGLAVVNDQLTTIGGLTTVSNRRVNTVPYLLSLSKSTWTEVLPSMPTNRMNPAAVSTPTHLIVAQEGSKDSARLGCQKLKC